MRFIFIRFSLLLAGMACLWFPFRLLWPAAPLVEECSVLEPKGFPEVVMPEWYLTDGLWTYWSIENPWSTKKPKRAEAINPDSLNDYHQDFKVFYLGPVLDKGLIQLAPPGSFGTHWAHNPELEALLDGDAPLPPEFWDEVQQAQKDSLLIRVDTHQIVEAWDRRSNLMIPSHPVFIQNHSNSYYFNIGAGDILWLFLHYRDKELEWPSTSVVTIPHWVGCGQVPQVILPPQHMAVSLVPILPKDGIHENFLTNQYKWWDSTTVISNTW
ncbi:MAG: hypothetical protein AAF804_07540 [Bacteroidota bacterium]